MLHPVRRSGHDAGRRKGKETTMALIHPSDRVRPCAPERKTLHPIIGLLGGFGLIILATVIVHTTFGAIL